MSCLKTVLPRQLSIGEGRGGGGGGGGGRGRGGGGGFVAIFVAFSPPSRGED